MLPEDAGFCDTRILRAQAGGAAAKVGLVVPSGAVEKRADTAARRLLIKISGRRLFEAEFGQSLDGQSCGLRRKLALARRQDALDVLGDDVGFEVDGVARA